MTAKKSDKGSKGGKKDEPTKRNWKKKVEDLPGAAKEGGIRGGGGGGGTQLDLDVGKDGRRAN